MSEMFTDTETHTMRARGGCQIHACMRTDQKEAGTLCFLALFHVLEEACLSTFGRNFNSVKTTGEPNYKMSDDAMMQSAYHVYSKTAFSTRSSPQRTYHA